VAHNSKRSKEESKKEDNMKPDGLTNLSLEELKRLLGFIHRNEVEFPLTAQRIACIGMQHKHQTLMNALRGLDAKAIRAVVVCVIAERMSSLPRAPIN